AAWTEMSRSDYFSTASTPAVPMTVAGFHPSQANLFASGLSVPAQTPAAIEIPSFSASSPSYFPSTSDHPTSGGGPDHEPGQGFQLPAGLYRNGSVAVPAELNMQQISGETVSRLLEQVLNTEKDDGNGNNANDSDRNTIMLLDMRPSVSHAASTIKTAVNVCIPNILLKRPMYSLQMVTEQLTTEQDIEIFSRWRQFPTIVFFDASGAAPLVGSPTVYMAQKLRKEGCGATLAYLLGT
ncbi:hypothetical protein BGZ65_008967, partial [Modicella reniformis]